MTTCVNEKFPSTYTWIRNALFPEVSECRRGWAVRMTKRCAQCKAREAVMRDLCCPCSRLLPDLTRMVYQRGGIETWRAKQLIELRRTSVKTLRGGRYTPL